MPTIANRFDIGECRRATAGIEADLRQLAASLTDAQFHVPARDGGWSVGYCIEHLVLSGRAFLPKWDRALDQANKKNCANQAAFPYNWWQRKILQHAENPWSLKQK